MDRRELGEVDRGRAARLAGAGGRVQRSGVPTGTAWTVIGPGGAFWISTVRSFTQPICVQAVVVVSHARVNASTATVA